MSETPISKCRTWSSLLCHSHHYRRATMMGKMTLDKAKTILSLSRIYRKLWEQSWDISMLIFFEQQIVEFENTQSLQASFKCSYNVSKVAISALHYRGFTVYAVHVDMTSRTCTLYYVLAASWMSITHAIRIWSDCIEQSHGGGGGYSCSKQSYSL